MDEAALRLEIQHLLRKMGYWDYHPPDDTPVATPTQINQILKALSLPTSKYGVIQNILKPPTWKRESISMARPDIYGLNPTGPTVVIEVKRIDPKAKIEAWFDPANISDGQRAWLDMWCYDADGQGFLGIGTIESPRRMWIYPWKNWVEMEKRLGEKDLHFKITLSDLSEEWELIKVTGGWDLPSFHSLLSMAFPNSSPSLYIGKTQPHSFRFTKKEGQS